MTRRFVLCVLAAALVALGGSPATLAANSEALPANTWAPIQMDWKSLLKDVAEDAKWQTGDGFSDNVWRTKSGEILIRTGIASKQLGLSPGFYTNTTVAWDVKTDTLRVVEISTWGGGSSGGATLPLDFTERPTPTPRHTYDGICYVPEEDAMYMLLGANGRMTNQNTAEEIAAQHRLDNNKSTWKYEFKADRWQRIDHNVRKFWPNVYRVSPYEAHLSHWPEGGKLLFFNDRGDHYAEFDLKSKQWSVAETANPCPMSLYNARSTWDTKRGHWVFRLGPSLCTFDPQERKFATLPECWTLIPAETREERKKEPRWHAKGVCYIDKHDALLVTGPTGNDTRVYHFATGKWSDLKAGDAPLPNGYCQYDPISDTVLMNYQHQCYKLRYAPQ